MNESGSLDGYFIFDRSKKFVFKKKLEISEHITNDMLLRSVYFNQTSVVMVDQGWCFIDFPMEIALISTKSIVVLFKIF